MKIHEEGTPDIIQFGPYRSGSTFMYQYLKLLFPDKKVLKCHNYREEPVPVVMTIRDFRDSVISYWRVDLGSEIIIGEDFMTKEDIDYYSEEYVEFDEILDKYLLSHDEVLVLRYEDFNNDFEYLHDQMSEFFGIYINDYDRTRIDSQCSKDHNRKEQEKYQGFAEYSEETGLHGDHIFTGESIFDQVVPNDLKGYFNDKLSVILNNWNYE